LDDYFYFPNATVANSTRLCRNARGCDGGFQVRMGPDARRQEQQLERVTVLLFAFDVRFTVYDIHTLIRQLL
jgi:hypothetical protein